VVEVLIAIYVKDAIIRPYGGDFLVVILMYCCVRAVFNVGVKWAAVGVLLFAFLIEGLQYIHIVDRLGLQNHQLARTVIGVGFEWFDLLAYTLGVIFIIVIESMRLGVHSVLYSK
jgi:hypothetical protein